MKRETAAVFAVLPLIGGLVHWGVNAAVAVKQKNQEAQRQKAAEQGEVQRQKAAVRQKWIDQAIQQGIRRYENTPREGWLHPIDGEPGEDNSPESAQVAAFRYVLQNIGMTSFSAKFRETEITQVASPEAASTTITWKLQGSLVYTNHLPGGQPQLLDWSTEQAWDPFSREWTVGRSSMHFRGLLSNSVKPFTEPAPTRP